MKPALLYRAFCLLLLLCPIPFSAAQTLSNYGHQIWTTENGLPQNSVHAILQSHNGYLWIATEGGVARFDGLEFRLFHHENTPAITSDNICCLAQTTGDRGAQIIWFGTADGLLRYESGSLRRYTVAEGLPSADILDLATDSTSLYVLTSSGVASFNGTSFSTVSLPSSPLAIATSIDGDGLLIATSTGMMRFWAGKLSRSYVQPTPTVEPLEAFGTVASRTLWQQTRDSLTFTANGIPRTIYTASFNGAHVQSFLAGSHGALWVGTSKGLYHFDNAAAQPQVVSEIGGNSVLSLYEDIEGDLWVGTETSGLHVLRRRNFTTLPAFGDRVITAISQTNDGAMWLGSNGDGVDRLFGGTTHHLSTHDGLLSDVILSFAPGSEGDLWVGTADGLNHIKGNRVDHYTSADGLPDDFVRSLLLDSNNALWIGTRHGLARLQGQTFTAFTQANGLHSDLIGAILQPDNSGDLWIATLNGLSLLHNNTIKTFTIADGLSGNIITALFEDASGNLWIGTRGNGLSLRTSNGRFVAFNRKDLPQTIDSIVGDNNGSLWLGFSHGITRVASLELVVCASSSPCALHLHNYGTADGMPTEEITAIGHPAAWQTTEGPLWFATRKGVAIVDPNHLFINKVPPPVNIERFTVDDADVHDLARIQPGHTRFVLEYAGLSFVAPAQVRYRYMLQGFDKQWNEVGARRTAYYTNLPHGSYRFRVQAANNDGVWNETGAELSFTIRPPFYRTLWFYLLASALLVGLIVLIYRLRLHRLRSQFAAVLAERARVAREIHDTLAQSFVGVSVQLELATQLLAHQQIDAARQQLDQTSAYVREGIDEARRSIWDLRAATAQNTLPTRLSRLAEGTGTNALPLQINIGGTYRPLDSATENEVLRIAQEALSNISRHAQATTATIELRYETSRLTLTVADNGHGFSLAEAQATRGRFGLQGMRERAEQIGGKLSVLSSPAQGTRITLDLPLNGKKGA